MAALLPHLSVTVSQRSRSCVLDPNLLLTTYGLEVVKSLGTTLELWVARELWHILNNLHFYQQYPQSLLFQTVSEQSNQFPLTAELDAIRSLQYLASFKTDTDLAHLNLFWIGDTPGESCFPPNTDSGLLHRWEHLAQALEVYIDRSETTCDVLTPVWRDTLSLVTALDAAFILTVQPMAETKQPPKLCKIMEQWGIPCREIAPLDAIATLERDNLRQLIVQAGLAKFLWAGLHLAVLHLLVPSATTMFCETNPAPTHHFSMGTDETDNSALTPNPWNGSQGFWYCL